MSYDFQMLPRDRVDQLLRAYENEDPDSLEINPGAPIPEREEWKRRVRDALVAHEPRFSAFPFGFAEIAEMEGITESVRHETDIAT